MCKLQLVGGLPYELLTLLPKTIGMVLSFLCSSCFLKPIKDDEYPGTSVFLFSLMQMLLKVTSG